MTTRAWAASVPTTMLEAYYAGMTGLLKLREFPPAICGKGRQRSTLLRKNENRFVSVENKDPVFHKRNCNVNFIVLSRPSNICRVTLIALLASTAN
jgi:hypothetical protein